MTTKKTTICPVCGKKHYGQCHKCPHQAAVKAGKYSDAQFERTPCFGCRSAENPSHKGKGCVCLEAADYDVPMCAQDGSEQVADFFGDWMDLTYREQTIILCRWKHEKGLEAWTYERIGKRFRMTRQAVKTALESALEKVPALRSVM